MNWTIAYNGTEKLLADWGLVSVRRELVSQGLDELNFKADGAAADGPPLFAYRSTIVLYRDRVMARDGTFSGGTPWFSGLLIRVPREGSPNSESVSYQAVGPWWYFDNLVFQQPYENVFLGFTVPDDSTTPAIYGQANSSHIFLNQAGGTALAKITNGQQIVEALNWVLRPFILANVTPPFQIGTITPTLDVPIDEVRDITCAEVIHRMMRWSPDAAAYFDYTTTPPTFNVKERAAMTSVNVDISST